MAEPIFYDPPKDSFGEKTHREAYEELDALVKMLHQRGVFRLLYDVTGALPQLSLLLASELNSEVGRRRTSNLYVLVQALGKIPPDEFKRIAEAVGAGIAWMGRGAPDDEPYPPGLAGVRKLLRDEELWDALGPALEGMKAFTEHLQRSDVGKRG